MDRVLAAVAGLAIVGLVIAWVAHDRRVTFWLGFLPPFVPIAYIDRYHFDLPAALKWAPFLGVAFAGAAAFLWLPRRQRVVPPELIAGFGAVLGVSLASMVLNGTAWQALLVAQRGYVILFCALWALYSARDRIRTDQLFAFFVVMGLVSCGVAVLQRVFVVPFVPGPDPGDRVTGLFPVGFITLFFHLFCIIIVISYQLVGRRLLPGSPWWVLGILVLGIAVGNQKAAIPYLALVLLATVFLVRTPRAGALRRGAVLVGSLVALAGTAVVFAAIYDRDYERGEEESILTALTDGDYVERYLLGTAEMNTTPSGRLLRGSALQFAWRLISDDPATLLVGLGPGATSESRVAGATGTVAQRYPGYAVDRLALSMVLADTGLLGLAAHGLFLYALMVAGARRGEPPEHRAIRRLFVSLFVSFSVYANLYYEPVFGLVAASLAYQPMVAPVRRARLEARCASA